MIIYSGEEIFAFPVSLFRNTFLSRNLSATAFSYSYHKTIQYELDEWCLADSQPDYSCWKYNLLICISAFIQIKPNIEAILYNFVIS